MKTVATSCGSCCLATSSDDSHHEEGSTVADQGTTGQGSEIACSNCLVTACS